MIYEFLSKPLPKGAFEDHDLEEMILETKGQLEDAHQFEKAISFVDLIEKQHPKFHKNLFSYLDDLKVDYHCFHNNPEGIKKGKAKFISNPQYNFDATLNEIFKVAFYQYTDLLEPLVKECYENIEFSSIDFDLQDLKLFIFNIELEKAFEKGVFNVEEFKDLLLPYLKVI